MESSPAVRQLMRHDRRVGRGPAPPAAPPAGFLVARGGAAGGEAAVAGDAAGAAEGGWRGGVGPLGLEVAIQLADERPLDLEDQVAVLDDGQGRRAAGVDDAELDGLRGPAGGDR